ncbi:MAG: hypothetical protein ABH865_08545 [Candidatus Omnitrophota bacterium]
MEILKKLFEIALIPITYFAGVQRGKFNKNKEKIVLIAQNYVNLLRQHNYDVYQYPDVLLAAGILTLSEMKDINQVIDIVVSKYGVEHPFKNYSEVLKSDNTVLDFFKNLVNKSREN